MIFKRDDEPGTPAYGRPYEEEDDPGTRDPERTASAGPVAPTPAEGVRETGPDTAPHAPDWSGARSGHTPGTSPERDETPGREPAADRPRHDRGDRLVAGHPRPRGETEPGTTAPAGDEALTAPASGSPEAEGHTLAGRHAAGDETGETAHDTHDTTDDLFGWDADEVRRRWHEVQVAFVDDPRESVERADAMVEEAVSALSARRRDLMDDWKNLGQGDTERLRLALRDYRSLLERLTGPFHGTADRGVR